MSSSYDDFSAKIYEEKVPNMETLGRSSWIQHIQKVLQGTKAIMEDIRDNKWYKITSGKIFPGKMKIVFNNFSVVVHCSDGWDRTSQLVSLALLLVDPFYRMLGSLYFPFLLLSLSFTSSFSDIFPFFPAPSPSPPPYLSFFRYSSGISSFNSKRVVKFWSQIPRKNRTWSNKGKKFTTGSHFCSVDW